MNDNYRKRRTKERKERREGGTEGRGKERRVGGYVPLSILSAESQLGSTLYDIQKRTE